MNVSGIYVIYITYLVVLFISLSQPSFHGNVHIGKGHQYDIIPSRQLTVNWQPTMLKFHKESDFHLPQSQNCLLGSYPHIKFCKILWYWPIPFAYRKCLANPTGLTVGLHHGFPIHSQTGPPFVQSEKWNITIKIFSFCQDQGGHAGFMESSQMESDYSKMHCAVPDNVWNLNSNWHFIFI